MWLLWISIALFIIAAIYAIVLHLITAGFWILIAFGVFFLIVHLFVRAGTKRPV